MTTPIVERKEGFIQVCVWPGTVVGSEHVKDFEAFFAGDGYRVQYLEEVTTKPDLDMMGMPEEDTGGRIDTLFAVHKDDVSAFAVPRLMMGIRWIEDVLSAVNHSRHMYDCERLDQYKSWEC